MVKILSISDTHSKHDSLILPDADILIHCGDATNHSKRDEIFSFGTYMGNAPYKYKYFVPGNHDRVFFSNYSKEISALFGDTKILLNDYIQIEEHNLSIFGCSKGTSSYVPSGVDILITHYPPKGVLDIVPAGTKNNPTNEDEFIGSNNVLELVERIKPKYHLFGHVHENGHRKLYSKDTTYINAACLCPITEQITRHGIVINL